MKLSNKGQLGLYEAIVIVVLVGCLGGLGYMYVHRSGNSQTYQGGSKPKVTDLDNHPSFGGCMNLKVEEYMEGQKNATK